tara:strand:- start:12768 stop:14579 length:1812 start_codon:yes stop_codon:yes gene_type:complete
MKLFYVLKVINKLGFSNVLSILVYKIKITFFSKLEYSRDHNELNVFFEDEKLKNHQEIIDFPFNLFGWKKKRFKKIPVWNQSLINKKNLSTYNGAGLKYFSKSNDNFDVKEIWEMSRFYWAPYISSLSLDYDLKIETLNLLISDWIKKNPPFIGINWACGQEASIRIIHIAFTSLTLGHETKMSDHLLSFVKIHLKRINYTINYGIAQNNNHGITEAVALYLGGSWLEFSGCDLGKKYKDIGLKYIENRCENLIMEDGSFSMYSINYHRMILDELSFAEVWRRKFGLEKFSKLFYQRLKNASYWLLNFIQEKTGEVPNLGTNDGTLIFPISGSKHRDFRPSIQLSLVLFDNVKVYSGKGEWNLFLKILKIPLPKKRINHLSSCQYENGGCNIIRDEQSFILLNTPIFSFRPSQSDFLHLDFWFKGENILRDGGSYSYYNSKISNYFSSVECHNTVQFDHRDQMPKISNFLYGEWIKAKSKSPLKIIDDVQHVSASYVDYKGAYHKRSVSLYENKLEVTDEIKGFKINAILRWRLIPSQWKINSNEKSLQNNKFKIYVVSNSTIHNFKIITGYESIKYLQKTKIPVLNVEFKKPSIITTTIKFN